MKTYRLQIRCNSLTLSTFQADTVFGHLCWVVASHEGPDSLKKFLEPFLTGEPPFVLSEGFPEDLLPRPLSSEYDVKDATKRKEIRKIDFVSLHEFEEIRSGEELKPREYENPFGTMLTHHNTISRLSNTTAMEGGVYSLRETFIPFVTVYLKTISDEWTERVLDLFKILSKSGYGRKKSIGKGQFSVEEFNEFTFKALDSPNGFVTLSSFCPSKNDPVKGLYKTYVKYGKLGDEYTFSGNPFKRPLVMVRTGSVFGTDGPPNDFYGRMVKGISPGKPDVVQYAYALSIPIFTKHGSLLTQ